MRLYLCVQHRPSRKRRCPTPYFARRRGPSRCPTPYFARRQGPSRCPTPFPGRRRKPHNFKCLHAKCSNYLQIARGYLHNAHELGDMVVRHCDFWTCCSLSTVYSHGRHPMGTDKRNWWCTLLKLLSENRLACSNISIYCHSNRKSLSKMIYLVPSPC